MPPSPGGSTSSESVDGLLGDVGSPGRRVAAWALRDAVQAARAAAASVSSPSETTNDDQDVEPLRLRLQVATDQLVRAPPRLPPPAAGCRIAGGQPCSCTPPAALISLTHHQPTAGGAARSRAGAGGGAA